MKKKTVATPRKNDKAVREEAQLTKVYELESPTTPKIDALRNRVEEFNRTYPGEVHSAEIQVEGRVSTDGVAIVSLAATLAVAVTSSAPMFVDAMICAAIVSIVLRKIIAPRG